MSSIVFFERGLAAEKSPRTPCGLNKKETKGGTKTAANISKNSYLPEACAIKTYSRENRAASGFFYSGGRGARPIARKVRQEIPSYRASNLIPGFESIWRSRRAT